MDESDAYDVLLGVVVERIEAEAADLVDGLMAIRVSIVVGDLDAAPIVVESCGRHWRLESCDRQCESETAKRTLYGEYESFN